MCSQAVIEMLIQWNPKKKFIEYMEIIVLLCSVLFQNTESEIYSYLHEYVPLSLFTM